MSVHQLRDHTHKQLAHSLKTLKDLVNRESPSGDAARLGDVSREIASLFGDFGASISWDTHDTGDHLILDIPGAGDVTYLSQKPVLLLLHHDTVWPVGHVERMPWADTGEDSDRRISGPGVFDMKGGIVVALMALRSLTDLGRGHPPLRIISTADEEVGSPTARALIEAQAGLVQAVLGFEPPHPDGALKSARRGSTRVLLSITGRSAHAALNPEEGVSAIDELVDQLARVRALTEQHPDVLCNVGSLSAPGQANVVNAHAEALIGLRFTSLEREKSILSAIDALLPLREGAALEAKILSNRPTWPEGDANAKLIARLQAAASDLGVECDARPASGAGDTNISGALGIPSIDGLGPIGHGAHAIDEYIVVESMPQRAALLAHTLNSWKEEL